MFFEATNLGKKLSLRKRYGIKLFQPAPDFLYRESHHVEITAPDTINADISYPFLHSVRSCFVEWLIPFYIIVNLLFTQFGKPDERLVFKALRNGGIRARTQIYAGNYLMAPSERCCSIWTASFAELGFPSTDQGTCSRFEVFWS